MLQCQCPSVCPSVCLWRKCIGAYRFQIPIPIYRALRSRCMRARGKASAPGRVDGSSRAMLATARPSCFTCARGITVCWPAAGGSLAPAALHPGQRDDSQQNTEYSRMKSLVFSSCNDEHHHHHHHHRTTDAACGASASWYNCLRTYPLITSFNRRQGQAT